MAIALPPLPHQAQLDRLRGLSQVDLQPDWRFCSGDLPLEEALVAASWSKWAAVALSDRAHIAWEAGKQVLWLAQRFEVPAALRGYDVAGHQIRLDLTWWADRAEIFVNGQLVQEGDLFDCVTKFCLTKAARPGETFDLAMRLTSPGHDRGALVLSQIRFEAVGLPGRTLPEPGSSPMN
ncbi:MAG: hypothetical protein HC824_20240 [Synechococcales cyanobacterium RM1_1_8]|nr:hypothetical protein [Synechococcales cyanobacterium RM1_1_8]